MKARNGKRNKQTRSQARDAGPVKSSGVRRFVIVGLILSLLLSGALLANSWWVNKQRDALQLACENAVSSGDWVELEKMARQWAVVEPDRAEPWSYAAAAARAMGQLESCAAYLLKLPDSAPADALHELSLLQLDTLKDPLAAHDTLTRILRLYPADVEASLRLMAIDAMLCRRDAVRLEALAAISNRRDVPATYAYLVSWPWLTFNNGYSLNQMWLEAHPQHAQLFRVAAAIHQMFGNTAAAESSTAPTATLAGDTAVASESIDRLSLLKQLLEEYPEDKELLNLRLSQLLQAGEVQAVGDMLKQLPETTRSDHRFWRYLGWHAAAGQQLDEAQKAYEQAIKLCPTDWTSQNELASILRRSQGIEAAAQMQSLAQSGIELGNRILAAPNLQALSADDYSKLADYLERCGLSNDATRLRSLL